MRKLDVHVCASIVVGAAVTAACWLIFSPSLDDRDAALFLAGVKRFDVAEHRPHPPGYPVYILLGKLLAWLCGDPRLGLQAVSCVGAGVSVGLLPTVFRSLGLGIAAAWALCAAALATPVFWLTGSKILTDMPGFALFLGLVCGLTRARPAGFAAGLAAGLAAGVRPHLLIPLAPLLLRARVGARLGGVAVGVAVWWTGSMLVVGAGRMLGAAARQASMRFEEPGVSLFSPDTWPDGALLRARHFGYVFLRDVLGAETLLPQLACLALLAAGSWIVWRRLGRHADAGAVRPLVAGTLVYAVTLFAFLPAHPRYMLLCVPVCVLALTGAGRVPLALMLAAAMLPQVVTRTAMLRENVAPPDLALAWMDRIDPDRELALLPGALFSHARLIAPERVEHGLIGADLERMTAVRRFFTDRDDLARRAEQDDGGLRIVDIRRFERPVVLHDKDPVVTVLLLERTPD